MENDSELVDKFRVRNVRKNSGRDDKKIRNLIREWCFDFIFRNSTFLEPNKLEFISLLDRLALTLVWFIWYHIDKFNITNHGKI